MQIIKQTVLFVNQMIKSKKNFSSQNRIIVIELEKNFKKISFLFLLRIIFSIDSHYRKYLYQEFSSINSKLIQLDEHPNFLQIEAIYETDAKIIYITEYCNVSMN
jgi:hypothetical protein